MKWDLTDPWQNAHSDFLLCLWLKPLSKTQ